MRIVFFSAALFASSLAIAATPIDGWYSSVFGGYTYIPDNVKKTYYGYGIDRASYGSGYNAGGRFGFQSNPMRYEAELTYIQAKAQKFSINERRQRHASGHNTAALAMGNVYYDFPEMVPCIAPYLGIGLGYGWVEADLRSRHDYRFYGPTHFKGSSSAFAYQGTAGITFNFSENYAFNLAYRYVGTDHIDHVGKVFQANLASIGVVYRFNEYNYK